MKIKDIILEKKEPPKPRNFVAKNAKMGGAGAHKNKKKAQKQGDVKHKNKEIAENADWLKGKEELNLKYYDNIFVENTNEGVLVHGEDIEGGYADQDGGESSGYFNFVANLNTGKIDLEYEDYNDSNNSYADSTSMEEIVQDILGDIKSEYGSTWEEITSELHGGFGLDEVRDPEDWDEGNTEPPNNFAVYINGKKWKVFKGRGQFADDYKERDHYRQLQNWAQAKSAATGKKWEVYVTGEPATESIAEKAPPGFKGTVKAMKKHKDIDNPFALAWSMKNKGYKSHKKADGSDK
jgi:hypothetical protein